MIIVTTNFRKLQKYAVHRSEPNHSERLPTDKLTTVQNIEHGSHSLSIPITTTTEIMTVCNQCSGFNLPYKAEPNGSTVLHAACYHGHYEIVKLLLEAGVDDNAAGTTPINKIFEKIEKNYINFGLTYFDRMEEIRRFFEKATKDQDPTWIIKA